MQRIVFLNMYISLYARTSISISARRGHESGLKTTCWFYAEYTGVPHHNYLQNLNSMQRGETGAKTFLLSSKMILQYMLRKVPYAVSMPSGHSKL